MDKVKSYIEANKENCTYNNIKKPFHIFHMESSFSLIVRLVNLFFKGCFGCFQCFCNTFRILTAGLSHIRPAAAAAANQ